MNEDTGGAPAAPDSGGAPAAPPSAPPTSATNGAAPPEPAAPAAGPPANWNEGLEQYNFQDFDAFKGAFNSAQEMISRSVRMLGPDAAPEAREAQLTKIREHFPEMVPPAPPKDASEYRYTEVEGWKNQIEDDRFHADTSMELGLTNEQSDGVRQAYAKRAMADDAAMKREQDVGVNKLRAEWGDAFERNLNLGQQFLTVMESKHPGITEVMKLSGVTEDASMMRFLHDLAMRTGESGAHQPGRFAGKMTATEAAQKIQDVGTPDTNPNHPRWNQMHPAHEEARQEYDRLTLISMGRT